MPANFLVVGGGNTGRFWVNALSCGGNFVAWYVKSNHRADLKTEETVIAIRHNPDGTTEKTIAKGIQVVSDYPSLTGGAGWYVIPAVRSYDIRPTVKAAAEALGGKMRGVIIPTNGIEGEKEAREGLQGFSGALFEIMSATLTLPCEIEPNDPRVVHIKNNKGGVGLAIANWASADSLRALVFNLNQCRPLQVMEFGTNWEGMKWSKLAMNVLGNVLCALTGLSPTKLYQHPEMRILELHMLADIAAAMHGQGIKLVDLPGYPAKTLRRLFYLARVSKAAGQLAGYTYNWQAVPKIIAGRGDKPPSMLQDIQAGRGKLENLPQQVVDSFKDLPCPPELLVCQFLADALDAAAWRGDVPFGSTSYQGKPELLWENYLRFRRQNSSR